jgi:hypothetical protein
MTAKVVDENGLPVKGAQVTLSFSGAKIGDGGGLTNFGKKGLSDDEGLFSDSAETLPLVGVVADKENYYRSIQKHEFTSYSKILNRWEPWNPTVEVVLKKKRNPVPMYSKYIEALSIPVLGSKVGYDLEKGDWVAPHGTGIMNDFVFLCENKYESFTSAETSCEITFSNPEDGLREFEFAKDDPSLFKWPFEAPTSGYNIKKVKKWMSVHLPTEPYKSNYKENINYLFRVRSEVDGNGNVIKANYGKLQGDIRVYKKAQISFFYHFNPDGTSNLEEYPEKNLFEK